MMSLMMMLLLVLVLVSYVSSYSLERNVRSSFRVKENHRIVSSNISPSTSRTRKTNLFMNKNSNDAIITARTFGLTNFGYTDPLIFDEDSFVGDLESYLKEVGKELSAIQRAVPDLAIQPYGFIIDEKDSEKVWFKIRPKGTFTGPLSYKGEVYLPNQKIVEFPIQKIYIKVKNNKIYEVGSKVVVDRLVGNTGGLPSFQGLLYALGEKPSPFQYLPPIAIVKNFFRRSVRRQSRNVGVSPFPDTVMFFLAKQLLEGSFGAKTPEILSNNFIYSSPSIGPLSKKDFLNSIVTTDLKTGFPDFSFNAYNFEIDAYDPERVWLISKPTGTNTEDFEIDGKLIPASGNKYDGPPEAISISINEEGQCYSITSGFVLDKYEGNTNGLGGIYGVLESIGTPVSPLESRSIPDFIDSLFPKQKQSQVKKIDTPKPVIAEVKKPVAEVKKPIVEVKKPIVEVKKPVVEVKKPIVEVKKPIVEVKKPIVEVKKESFSPFWGSSAAKEVKPSPVVAKAAEVKKPTPVVAKAAEVKKPIVEVKKPIVEVKKPIVEVKKESFSPFWGSSSKEVKPSPVVTKAAEVKKPTPVVAKAAEVKKPVVEVKKPEPVAKVVEIKKPELKVLAPPKVGSVVNPWAQRATATKVPTPPSPTKVATPSPPTKVATPSPPTKAVPPPSPTKVPPPPSPTKVVPPPTPTKVVPPQAGKILNSNAVKALASVGQSGKLGSIENLVNAYTNGKDIGAEAFVKDLIKIVGTKDNATTVLPDIIGSLPRGDKKSTLNSYYSQI